MKTTTWICNLLTVAVSALGLSLPNAQAEEGYGTLKGQFVLTGEIPEPDVLVKKGNIAQGKDPVCAAHDILSESLVVDEKSKGIANVFIYLPRATKIHPDLKESKEKEVVFDQRGCQFIPHAMFVRTDQQVVVKSDDNCQHNTHTFPIRNRPVNFILPPKDRKGVKISTPAREFLPIQVKCDIHPWMNAYWLILDHPYAAVTADNGTFQIEKLPAGEHKFFVWQEKVGYLLEQKVLTVEIKSGETTDLGKVEVAAERFEEK